VNAPFSQTPSSWLMCLSFGTTASSGVRRSKIAALRGDLDAFQRACQFDRRPVLIGQVSGSFGQGRMNRRPAAGLLGRCETARECHDQCSDSPQGRRRVQVLLHSCLHVQADVIRDRARCCPASCCWQHDHARNHSQRHRPSADLVSRYYRLRQAQAASTSDHWCG